MLERLLEHLLVSIKLIKTAEQWEGQVNAPQFCSSMQIGLSNNKPKSFCNCSRTFWVYIAPFAFVNVWYVHWPFSLLFFNIRWRDMRQQSFQTFKESVKKPAVWNIGFSCFGGLGNLDSWRVQLKKVKFVARFWELIWTRFGAQFWGPISGPNLELDKEKRGGGAKAEP